MLGSNSRKNKNIEDRQNFAGSYKKAYFIKVIHNIFHIKLGQRAAVNLKVESAKVRADYFIKDK